MTHLIRHAPGTFCWPELATSDSKGAKTFYAAIFGWTAVDHPMGPDGVYTIFQLDGKDVAAGHQLMPQQAAQGVQPHWMSYISTDSADNSLNQAEECGGKVLMAAMDVPRAGRMGTLQDPTGAIFSLWEGKEVPGIQVLDQPRSLVWTELLCTDAEKAKDFYTRLFGWGVQFRDSVVKDDAGPVTYTTFMRGEKPAGGMLQMTPDMGNMPSQWLPYFGVEDIDAAHARIKQAGGFETVPPSDVPNVGRFSVVQDPQGATFGLFASRREGRS